MCGIVGIMDRADVTSPVLLGLRKLEYRGYDSAGIAVIDSHSRLIVEKSISSIDDLSHVIKQKSVSGTLAIAHTRWATHGRATIDNAHPHYTTEVAIVHNGIIENHVELRKCLTDDGYVFRSQTDSETIAILLTSNIKKNMSIKCAFEATINALRGSYALVAIFNKNQNIIAIARQNAPVVVGRTMDNMRLCVGSDSLALGGLVEELIYLEDGDYAFIEREQSFKILNCGKEVKRASLSAHNLSASVDLGTYKHFMLKEIYEQPSIISKILTTYVNMDTYDITFPNCDLSTLSAIKRVNIIACGTSYNAGIIASYYLEQYANLNVSVYVASEFRDRNFCFECDGSELFIFISQSGETSDTIGSLKLVKQNKQKTISIINANNTTMERLSCGVIHCNAGIEISVASTKTFSAQLTVLTLLTLALARNIGKISEKQYADLLHEMCTIDTKMSILLIDVNIKAINMIAKTIAKCSSVIYLGKNAGCGLALEGALKLREISYIHAEGIVSGELKHGSMALIDENMTVIVSALSSNIDKLISGIEEVVSRGARIVVIGEFAVKARLWHHMNSNAKHSFIEIPQSSAIIAPLLHAIPLQLLAYYAACELGREVDRPRNLAKSVTVE